MLILRPSPLFQRPSKESVRECFSSAMKCSELYHKLYTANQLHYSWLNVHSLFLCVMTMFYCVWTHNGIADEVDLEFLMRTLNSVSDILSATGEYWPEAKRSRDVLNRISVATTRRFTQNVSETQGGTRSQQAATSMPTTTNTTTASNVTPSSNISLDAAANVNTHPGLGSDGVQQQSFVFGNNSFYQGQDQDQNASFGPYYNSTSDQFVSLDMLSYFMGSAGGDINASDAEVLDDYFPSVEEMMQNGFGNGFGSGFGNGGMGFGQDHWP